jgi:diguanylate cyclase (GGDEF)-like protein
VLARIGGDEFALLVRGLRRDEVLAFAERMRRSVDQQTVHAPHAHLTFTVSIGIAHSETGAAAGAQALLETADRALYEAKQAGRNHVSIAAIAG